MKIGSEYSVFDIESDDLLDKCTKIHCLSIARRINGVLVVKSTTNYEEMKVYFKSDEIKVGHNIINYDNRVVEKLLGVKVNDDTVIDTLPLSWYLFPGLKRHGLEEWGETFGIKKPKIKDWSELSAQEYIHRCEEDTKINYSLLEKILFELLSIYSSPGDAERLVDYLQFKMFCVREQEENPIGFDSPKAEQLLGDLSADKATKIRDLIAVMPQNPIKKAKIYRNVIKISETEFYTKGDMMFNHYVQLGHKTIQSHKVQVIKGYEPPNPNSVDQKKAWLYSLGWIPTTFKYVKEDDGTQRKVEQIMSDKKDGSLCPSVMALITKEPGIEILEGLSILTHRIGLVEGLIRDSRENRIQGSMAGFTNTLRLKHKNLVNLPGVDKKYGKEIRGLLIANEGDLLCGSDCSGLEDNCKQHYMYPYDPKYITEMRTPGFDPHLDIAELAGMLTPQQVLDHKSGVKSYKAERQKAKVVNFSCVYGAGAPKIALTSGMTLREAQTLHRIYWKRNKAVKQVAEAFTVKDVNGQKWLLNPISNLWYSLRAEKDRFSTGNQGLGVWCFDTWVKHVREAGIVINYQCHDEILFSLNGRSKEEIRDILTIAMDKTNKEINLNVPLAVSIDFGESYAACH